MIYHSMLATTRSLFWAIAMLRPPRHEDVLAVDVWYIGGLQKQGFPPPPPPPPKP